MAAFAGYNDGLSPFGTHQGVKELEFPRVLVILNDGEAGVFRFIYDKLLGVKPASDSDVRNQRAGLDDSLARTRRLLYVTCRRAEDAEHNERKTRLSSLAGPKKTAHFSLILASNPETLAVLALDIHALIPLPRDSIKATARIKQLK